MRGGLAQVMSLDLNLLPPGFFTAGRSCKHRRSPLERKRTIMRRQAARKAAYAVRKKARRLARS